MNKTAIVIPSRLAAQRLPNKPLKIINGKEMILHVYDAAIKAKVGEVIVATPDKKIVDTVNTYGGNAVLTSVSHQTGTDRVYEVYKNILKDKTDIIINLQGDMPNLNPLAIKNLADHLKKKTCDISTLASKLNLKEELNNPNVCKVTTSETMQVDKFVRALDFFRSSAKKDNVNLIYHHIGIYAFTNEALIRYVSLKRSKLEIKRKLEQLRALENKMKIEVGYLNDCPLSVDTDEDFLKIKKIMEHK